MYVHVAPNRNSRPTILLREGKRTLASLTCWPSTKIQTPRRVLQNEPFVVPEDAFRSVRSRFHSQVAAGLGAWHQLGLDRLLAAQPSRRRELAVALSAACAARR